MTKSEIISLIRQYASKTVASTVSIIGSLGFTPENIANKTVILSGDSDVLYPTQKTVKDALDLKVNTVDLSLKQDILFYDSDIGAFILIEEDYES